MKTITFLTFFALLFTLNVQAQTNTDTTLVISFDKSIHDYGTITRGGDGSCEFTFTNLGKIPLVLTNVSASCGCTVPEWTKEPVMPGKAGVIKVKYNTALIGNFTKSVTVTSNAKNSPVALVIKGKVVESQP